MAGRRPVGLRRRDFSFGFELQNIALDSLHTTLNVSKSHRKGNILDDDRGPRSGPAVESNGVGLRLLQDRLRALYQADASLELHAAAAGLSAVLELPVRAMLEDA